MTDSERKSLVKRRGMIKASVTRFASYVRDVDNNTSVHELKARLEKHEKCLSDFEAVHSELELMDDTDQTEELEDFENVFYASLAAAKEIIELRTGAVTSTAMSNSARSLQHADTNGVRLPTIKLVEFDGNYQNWPKFRDVFTSLIHNATIPDIQKFQYLQLSLKGRAAEVTESLELSNENYSVAWKLLEDRYQHNRLIVNTHVKALFDLPLVVKENVAQLRKLLDEFLKHFRALEALKQPVNTWDTLLIHVVTSKLDNNSKRLWETTLNPNEFPTVSLLIEFLNNRCHVLEMVVGGDRSSDGSSSKPEDRRSTRNTFTTQTNPRVCTICKKSHTIYNCPTFTNLNTTERWQRVKRLELCANCLGSKHVISKCNARSCYKCNGRHHTLLHNTIATEATSANDVPEVPTEQASTSQQNLAMTTYTRKTNEQVLMSTSYIYLLNKENIPIRARALLDSGSDENYMTRELRETLGLPETQVSPITVCGISGASSNVSRMVSTLIKSTCTSFEAELNFLVIPEIISRVPAIKIESNSIKIPKGIKLCDPNYNIPDKVDVLLGAELFYDLMMHGRIYLSSGPMLQETQLGWLVTGKARSQKETKQTSFCNFTQSVCDSLHDDLQRFWKLDECASVHVSTPDEVFCEQMFEKTTSRDSNGRFVVSLPAKNDDFKFGESLEACLKRQYALERRLRREPNLNSEYTKFMDEYETLGHMEKIGTLKEIQPVDKHVYYIPHHPVVKSSSSTTRVRVVFDASAKSTNGKSLNDQLRAGPIVQSDLFSILIRFRLYPIVVSADVEKMFRQVWLNEDQQDLQRIVWRNDETKPMNVYKLKTITYGTTPATYLTTRCLKELALKASNDYPEASKSILEDMYVDDLITGTNTVQEAVKIIAEIRKILQDGCFNLRKWRSNSDEVLATLEGTPGTDDCHLIKNADEIKTLGIIWNPTKDLVEFTSSASSCDETITKRTILSTIARIFDPLGLASPVVVAMKILIQKLWVTKSDWDEPVSEILKIEFLSKKRQLDSLTRMEVPRCVISKESPDDVQIHGFCDSSEKAYGAAIYVRSSSDTGAISVNLLCAKTRVAPLKRTTLPRLELAAALLLARLMQEVLNAIRFEPAKVFYWSDSEIVLSWIAKESSRWKTFVANRVAEIHQLTEKRGLWQHVQGKSNPADIISRGTREGISIDSTWFNGPAWLKHSEDHWPVKTRVEETILEARNLGVALPTTRDFEIFTTFSSLTKLQRVIAWCLRFKKKGSGPLSVEELTNSLKLLTRLAQRKEFGSDIDDLTKTGRVRKTSCLLKLNPFVDTDGLLRVGGRLSHGDFDYDKKHPILLPKKHPLTEMIIRNEHLRHLHLGAYSLLCVIRERYWPVAGINTVKRVIRKCVTCFRVHPLKSRVLMGDLPIRRITPSRTFENTSLDIAGPFLVKECRLRNRKLIKVYICIFICMATKAMHAEVLSDLSCENFINSLKRFAARRGVPRTLYSDNATNFVAASKELKIAHAECIKFMSSDSASHYMAEHEISWRFMPARSPHMGGLHEAAVKSMKKHLKIVLNNLTFTLEEFSTVVCQVEAILNSRPLFSTSNDPSDLTAITPGHFIIGGPLTALPSRYPSDGKITGLKRHEQQKRILHDLWQRWRREYLSQLQSRGKWRTAQKLNIKVGDLVILRDNNLPPQRWNMGRITNLHPGADGVVRVVTVKTGKGITKRATTQVCLLPMEDEVETPEGFKARENVWDSNRVEASGKSARFPPTADDEKKGQFAL